jgi:hypothetical protein
MTTTTLNGFLGTLYGAAYLLGSSRLRSPRRHKRLIVLGWICRRRIAALHRAA